MTIKNIIRNIVKPSYFPVITRKTISRFTETKYNRDRSKVLNWCQKNKEDWECYARQLDSSLWSESKAFSQLLKIEAEKKLKTLDINLGGGGNYPLLYFVTRLLKPEAIVETGVAAGYSTTAILKAILKNGKGYLYSSDFPYFRLNTPEKYIGVLVDNDLRNNWQLYIEGDQKNLKTISHNVRTIDLFHYDSDKTYGGRYQALKSLSPNFTPRTVIIMDDIQDNFFFRDYVEQNQLSFKIFSFENKYVGVIGL